METMQGACDTKPNITTDSTAFFEIKAANGDLFDTQTESATGQSAPTATGESFCLCYCLVHVVMFPRGEGVGVRVGVRPSHAVKASVPPRPLVPPGTR